MKLIFLIPSLTIKTSTRRTIKTVASGHERLDVITRCLLNLSQWKNRLDFSLSLVLYLAHPDEQRVFFVELDNLSLPLKSEFEAGSILIDLLENPTKYKIKNSKEKFENIILSFAETSKMIYLTPEGTDIHKINSLSSFQKDICFILGSQYDLSSDQEQILDNLDVQKISLGSTVYLASHVVTIICNQLFITKKS